MKIERIEWGRLEGTRPRKAGKNARLDEHGLHVRPPVARLTLSDGSRGFGVSRGTREQLEPFLGQSIDALFSPLTGVSGDGAILDYPLWDLAAKRAGLPVYALAAQVAGRTLPAGRLRVRCYDTTLYFDDLHLESNGEAAALIAQEAREGYERSHRAFKVKIGRGARHMELEKGMQRDVAILRAIREAVGTGPPIMVDANNGYNLNLSKRVLAETAGVRLFWLEEAFHEDAVLYRDLKEWMGKQGIETLVADGEGQASPSLLEWAREGIVDVVQYDYFGYGFSRWIETGKRLDAWGARTAPHHYGGHYGNYVSGHLAGAIERFTFVEWDEARSPGLDTSAYRVEEGVVTLPETPGFGLEIEEDAFGRAVKENGFTLTA